MSMRKFIDAGDPIGTPRPSINLPAGRYLGLLLILKGTTDTSQTLTASDVGRIRIERFGEQIHGERFEKYHEYTDLKGGHPTAVLPQAGATRIAAFIPFGLPEHPNTLDVADSEEVDVFFDFNDTTLNTRFDSSGADWELYGLLDPSISERYELHWIQQDIQATAAGRRPEKLNAKNIASLLLADSGSNVDAIFLTVDGETVTDNLDDEVIQDFTNLENQIESAGSLREINLIAGGRFVEAANNSTTIDPNFTGSGTLEVTILSVKFDSAGKQRSASEVASRVNQKIARAGLQNGNDQNASRPAGAFSN